MLRQFDAAMHGTDKDGQGFMKKHDAGLDTLFYACSLTEKKKSEADLMQVPWVCRYSSEVLSQTKTDGYYSTNFMVDAAIGSVTQMCIGSVASYFRLWGAFLGF